MWMFVDVSQGQFEYQPAGKNAGMWQKPQLTMNNSYFCLITSGYCWLLLLIAGYGHGCWLFSKVYRDRYGNHIFLAPSH